MVPVFGYLWVSFNSHSSVHAEDGPHRCSCVFETRTVTWQHEARLFSSSWLICKNSQRLWFTMCGADSYVRVQCSGLKSHPVPWGT